MNQPSQQMLSGKNADVKTENRPMIGLGIFVIRNGKVLLGKRLGKHGEDTWAPPGGHLDYGESPEAGAKRELLEETGLIAPEMIFLGLTNDLHPKNHYVTLFFACFAEGQPERVEPDKCAGWQWYKIEDFPSPQFLPVQNFFKQDCPLFETLIEKSLVISS